MALLHHLTKHYTFERPRAKAALQSTGGSDLVAALDWLCIRCSDDELASALPELAGDRRKRQREEREGRIQQAADALAAARQKEGSLLSRHLLALGAAAAHAEDGGSSEGAAAGLGGGGGRLVLRLETDIDWGREKRRFALLSLGFIKSEVEIALGASAAIHRWIGRGSRNGSGSKKSSSSSPYSCRLEDESIARWALCRDRAAAVLQSATGR